jgi:hypothetical protein
MVWRAAQANRHADHGAAGRGRSGTWGSCHDQADTTASAIVVTLDGTFIRSCEAGDQHLEVPVGDAETATGGGQVFGTVVRADTDIKALICQTLDAVGRTEDTILTGLTNGCPGLRSSLADAGITQSPMLDWFHIAMRLNHLRQVAGALSADDAASQQRRLGSSMRSKGRVGGCGMIRP